MNYWTFSLNTWSYYLRQDLNCGCPIDVVCDRGSGSALLRKHNKLLDIVAAMTSNLPSRQITVKLRTGWDEKTPSTHKLVPLLQKASKGRIAAIFVSIIFSSFLFSFDIHSLVWNWSSWLRMAYKKALSYSRSNLVSWLIIILKHVMKGIWIYGDI